MSTSNVEMEPSEGTMAHTENPTEQERRSRVRTLTEKGQHQFEERRQVLLKTVDSTYRILMECMHDFDQEPTTMSRLRICETDLRATFDRYNVASNAYLDFLSHQRISESIAEVDTFWKRFSETKTSVLAIFDRLEVIKSKLHDSESRTFARAKSERAASHYSDANSRASSHISLVARKRAKAEAAKVKLRFAEEQAKIKTQQSDINVKLDLLNQRAEVAAAEAEADFLEKQSVGREAEGDFLEKQSLGRNSIPHSVIPKEERTPFDKTMRFLDDVSLNAYAPEFFPTSGRQRTTPQSDDAASYSPNQKNNTQFFSDFGRYLLKKELIIHKFRSFDDKPEHYLAWKGEFKSIVAELQCSSVEELGLLTSHLGSESTRQATDIRTSCANDPDKCLKKIWQRLEERFGSPELVESALRHKLENFTKFTDMKKLYTLHDILNEIEAAKRQPNYRDIFAGFDSSVGIKPILQKLPHTLQEKWMTRADRYKQTHKVLFPPFEEFVNFIGEMSRIRNDPGLVIEPSWCNQPRKERETVHVRKVQLDTPKQDTVSDRKRPWENCIFHNHNKHSTNRCREFRKLTMNERISLLKEKNICFRCCETSSHFSRKCKADIRCVVCGSKDHCSALHKEDVVSHDRESARNHGEESAVVVQCTEICGEFNGKSCARILPVNVYREGDREHAINIYVMLDDQSNKTLGKGELFEKLRIGSSRVEYTMKTCSGSELCYGRTANDLVIESPDGHCRMNLPAILECDELPENYSEIPTPQVAQHYAHLQDIASEILPLDESHKILLLVGRDLSDAHIVLDQRIGPSKTPFGQKSPLGWSIIGDACLSRQHVSSVATVCKTSVAKGQSSLFEPCTQYLKVNPAVSNDALTGRGIDAKPPYDLFQCSPNDNKLGLSIDDRRFLDIMDRELHIDSDGRWVAPLPFRSPRKQLPNNYSQALKRAKTLDASLHKDPKKREHFLTFMGKLFDNGHAEIAPPLQPGKEVCYLPLFGVYHPHKPHQIRGVFDSSAKHDNVSLNDQLLSGPDLANNLLGVLIRFRREMIAVVGDIQHMFHCFVVREDDRDYLRFLWHRDNKLENELVEYRMTVHVFGNRPSSAIANYGLLKIASLAAETHGSEVRDFITNNFYVDDGLTSLSSSDKAISLIQQTQDALKTYGNLRLHKFASNDQSVMNAFSPEDLAKEVLELDFEKDAPLQRSLGLVWNLRSDTFQFAISSDPKPLSRRGVLSVVNSIYDPLGFLSPVTIFGKLILRRIVASTSDWDEPLPDDVADEWNTWKSSLSDLEDLRIPRVVVPHLSTATYKELLIYCDASEVAISAVAYLRVHYKDGSSATGFVLGKSKVAPTSGHTIPRLELCAAVLAVDISQTVKEHLQLDIDDVRYFTDSRVVLGYISNERKRFFMYVANRVAHIRTYSEPRQWTYVNTTENPADVGTRGISVKDLESSRWLSGPNTSRNEAPSVNDDVSASIVHPLINPEHDNEVRCKASSAGLDIRSGLGSHRFSRFSSWNSLIRAVSLLQRYIDFRKGKIKDFSKKTVDSYKRAEKFVIKTVQAEVFSEELECLLSSKPLPRHSNILSLDPILDDEGIIRVGGRLKRSKLDSTLTQPMLIPGKHSIATLLVRKHHTDVSHQGRHLTEGKVRSSGIWITGCKRLVSSLIHKCVDCRKLRGKLAAQKMSDLPEDRVTPGLPPFSSVGVDIFGPWEVVTRRTRGGSANSKRWAALFTCMATRAVHIEVIEEMSSSSFINALRRFIAIRGKVQIIRSDRGTNFVGAVSPLQMNALNVEDGPIKDFLHKNGTTWIFNAPHSSHMGGVWERMIGTTRRILDPMLLNHGARALTHEVLSTFLAEATSIINSRPLIPVSNDPNSPFILTPSLLLTQKTDSDSGSDINIEIDQKDLLRKQWKRVQYLSSLFWKRWKSEYLQTLQCRRKWHNTQRNVSEGDVVLLRDKDAVRNQWPMGVVSRVFPSEDDCVRKVELRVVGEGKLSTFVRPVHELVVLVES